MIGEFRNEGLGFLSGKKSIGGRPNKHVKRGKQRNINEEPRTKWFRRDAHFLQRPAAKILQGNNVAAPATNKAAEDQCRQKRERKEYEAGVELAALERVHAFGWLDRRNRPAGHSPLNDVGDHEQVDADEHGRTPTAGFRLAEATWPSGRNEAAAGRFHAGPVPYHQTVAAVFHSLPYCRRNGGL